MPTAQTTFRLTERDRRMLALLEDELACSKADVVRLGLAALRRDPDLRRQLRAERIAAAFLARLQDRYGRSVSLQVSLDPDDPRPRMLASRVADPTVVVDPGELQVQVRERDGTHFIDLIDPTTGVGIRNAYWTQAASDAAEVAFPLRAINFWRTEALDEPQTLRLPDGRTAIEVAQDDGSVNRYVLNSDGTTSLLDGDQRAAWFRDEAPTR